MDEYYVIHQFKPAVLPSGVLVMRKGETRDLVDLKLSFLGFKLDQSHMANAGMVVKAVLAVNEDKNKLVMPEYQLMQGGIINKPEVDIPGYAAKIRFEAMDATIGTVRLVIINPQGATQKATAVVEFTRVPLISIVWIGSILQILGCTISLMLRYRKKAREKPKAEVQEKGVKKTAKR
jgi:cytochrome c biogenesis factor